MFSTRFGLADPAGPGAVLAMTREATMSFRFTRRMSIIPGLRVNFSKHGASVSIGHRGAWYTIGPRGSSATIGLPGTGLYWKESTSTVRPVHSGHRLAFVGALLLGFYVFGKLIAG